MQAKNAKELESLSFSCHVGGLIILFMGILVAGMNFMSGEAKHVQEGIFIFISGYALVKISTKISRIVEEEKHTGY